MYCRCVLQSQDHRAVQFYCLVYKECQGEGELNLVNESGKEQP